MSCLHKKYENCLNLSAVTSLSLTTVMMSGRLCGELRTVSTTAAAAAATAAAAVPRDVNGRAGPALTPSRRGDYPLIGFLCLFAPRTPVS
jgi:hypothetical protein